MADDQIPPEPDRPDEATRRIPRPPPPVVHPPRPAASMAPPEPPRRSVNGWMVAFFALVLLAAAAAAVWLLVLRNDDGESGIALSAAAIDFGDQDLGKRSAAREITLTNGSGAPVTIVSLAIDGQDATDFKLTDGTTCSTQRPVEDGGSCVLGLSFKPTARGDRVATIVIRVAGGEGPPPVALRGSGVGEAAVVLETTRLDFGSVSLGKGRRTRQVTLTNGGNAPLAISELRIEGKHAGDFRIAKKTDCSIDATVKAGATCTIAISFAPREPGKRSAVLVIEHDGVGAPAQVALAGEGAGRAEVVLEPDAVDFGEVGVGGESDAATVTLRNAGTIALTVAGIALSGSDADDYRLEGGDCAPGDRIAPAAACTIGVVFAPADGGEREAAIEVTSGAGRVSEVGLTGVGLLEETVTTETG